MRYAAVSFPGCQTITISTFALFHRLSGHHPAANRGV